MRKVLHITIVSKSDCVLSKNLTSFTITTKEFGELACCKKILYDRFEIGKELDIIYQDSNRWIVGVVGFDPDIIEISPQERPPKNGAESVLYNKLSLSGWDITRRGYPDFACFKDGRFVAIEVKPKRSHRLKTRQQQVIQALAKAGVECYKWSPDGGFEQILESQDEL